MWTRVCAGLALAAVAVATACGGSGEGDKEKQAADRPCATARHAMKGEPALPAGFPRPAEVTYTGEAKQGPTTVVTGYFAGDIDKAFDTWKGSFHDPFETEHTEHEEVDAEIEFKGSGKEGQVKLLQTCKDRTAVTVTVRPA
jgi:hypothetical protein